MTRTSNIIPLRPYDPVPWETFATVDPPRREISKFWKAIAFLCVLAVVVGALFAANN